MVNSEGTQIKEAVKESIQKLLKDFKKKPHMFWSEYDVNSYLYSLLITNSSLKKYTEHKLGINHPKRKYEPNRAMEEGKTILVHTQVDFPHKREDISIFPLKVLDESTRGFDSLVGIEIKFNTRSGQTILNDVKSLKKSTDGQFGYMIWLNWWTPINPNKLEEVRKEIKNCRNVTLVYYDLYSKQKEPKWYPKEPKF